MFLNSNYLRNVTFFTWLLFDNCNGIVGLLPSPHPLLTDNFSTQAILLLLKFCSQKVLPGLCVQTRLSEFVVCTGMSWEVAEEEILEPHPPPTSPSLFLTTQNNLLLFNTGATNTFEQEQNRKRHCWISCFVPNFDKTWYFCTSVLLQLGWSWRMPEANPSRGWRPIWTHFLAPTPSHRCFLLPPHQPIYPQNPSQPPSKTQPPTFLTFRRSGCHCQFVPCRPSPKYAMYAQIFNSSETSPYMRWNSKQTLNMFSSQHKQH